MPQDLEKTESNITVKGIFIIPTIDEIKKRASEKEIAMLSKLIPNLKVSPFVSYPVFYYNDPYPLGGTEGVLYGGLEMLKLKNIDIKFIDHGNQDHEFIMSWQ